MALYSPHLEIYVGYIPFFILDDFILNWELRCDRPFSFCFLAIIPGEKSKQYFFPANSFVEDLSWFAELANWLQ